MFCTIIEHGEDEEVALDRLVGRRAQHKTFKWEFPVPGEQVSYFTIGGEEAGQLAGLVDARIISCYSHQVPRNWRPRGKAAETCRMYGIEDVIRQLDLGQWAPGNALSILSWLISSGLTTLSPYMRFPHFKRKLPHWRAMDCAPDRSESAND